MVRRSKAKFQPKLRGGGPTATPNPANKAASNNSNKDRTLESSNASIGEKQSDVSLDSLNKNNNIVDWISTGIKEKQPPDKTHKTIEQKVEEIVKISKIKTSNSEIPPKTRPNTTTLENDNNNHDTSKLDKNQNNCKVPMKETSKNNKKSIGNFTTNKELQGKRTSKEKSIIKVKRSRMDLKRKTTAIQKFKQLPLNESEEVNIDENNISISDLIYVNPLVHGKCLGMNKFVESESEITIPIETANEKETIAEVEMENQNDQENVLSGVAPQIRLNDDGSIVIDEESLIIPSQVKDTPDLTKSNPVIFDSSQDRVTSTSFSKRRFIKSIRWSTEDTNKFYRCLSVVGTDFKLMHLMYKGYSEDILRRKYRREIKHNPYRVDFALNQQHLNTWTEDMFEKDDDDSGNDSQTSTTTTIIERCDIEETVLECNNKNDSVTVQLDAV